MGLPRYSDRPINSKYFLVLYLELSHLVPLGLALDQGVNDRWGFLQQGWEEFLGSPEVIGVDVSFCRVVLEGLDEQVFLRVVGAAVPIEEEVALFGAGSLGKFRNTLAEIFHVLGQRTETNVNQNHASDGTEDFLQFGRGKPAPAMAPTTLPLLFDADHS